MTARPFSWPEALLRASPPLAALVAVAVFAAREPFPASAEGAWLAILAGAALLAAAFLEPAPGVGVWIGGLGAVLATAAVWSLPAGPGRGAAVTLLLTVTLTIAAARRLVCCLPELPLAVTVPLALGVQVLLRGTLLLHPALPAPAGLRTLVALLVLPTAGAVATTALARRHGGGPALLAAGTALVLAPGWNVAATLGLIALAAGDQLARPGLGRAAKGAALLVLFAPIAWAPGPGLAAAVAGLALWRSRRPQVAFYCALLVSLGLAWAGFRGLWGSAGPAGPGLPPREAVWLLPILLPGVVLPARGRVWSVLTALPLVAVTPWHPDASALAAPLALAALAVRREEPEAAPQQVWTGALAGGTALLAAYPWLRADPLLAALGLAGLSPGLRAGAVVLFVFLALALVLGPSLRPSLGDPGTRRALAGMAAGMVFLALWIQRPPAGLALLAPETGVMLDPAHPAWAAGWRAPRPVSVVVVDSGLSNGAALANGTPVATVRLSDETGQSALWVLRAGSGTGEWAARRPDVERTARLRSPPAWISWLAGDFFGQRYRARWTLLSPGRFSHLRVELARGLPADVGLTLHQVEVRR